MLCYSIRFDITHNITPYNITYWAENITEYYVNWSKNTDKTCQYLRFLSNILREAILPLARPQARCGGKYMTNETGVEILCSLFQLRNDIFNQVSAIPLDSIDNINTVTASISTISENPYEISQETQTKANELMNSMMNTIESLENVEAASESLTNILDISSKMLESNGAVANVNDQNNTDIDALKSEGADLSKVKFRCFWWRFKHSIR